MLWFKGEVRRWDSLINRVLSVAFVLCVKIITQCFAKCIIGKNTLMYYGFWFFMFVFVVVVILHIINSRFWLGTLLLIGLSHLLTFTNVVFITYNRNWYASLNLLEYGSNSYSDLFWLKWCGNESLFLVKEGFWYFLSIKEGTLNP